MKEKWYKDKEKFYLVTVMVIYIVYASIIICFHEPWRDEAQAWLIARDTNIIEMFSLSKSEGSPMLWHLLINVLTTLNLPYMSMHIFHMLLNICVIFVFNKYAPFSKKIKLGITFSHMIAYEYLVIARSYVLVPLLLFLIATIYEKRHEKTITYCILLLMLQNVCLHSIPISIILFITYIVEKIKHKKMNLKSFTVIIIVTLTIIISLLLMVNQKHSEQLYHIEFPQNFSGVIERVGKFLSSIGCIAMPVAFINWYAVIWGAVLLSFATVSLWEDKKVLVFFIFSTITIGGIFAFLNINIFFRHVYLYVVIYLFCEWIANKKNTSKASIMVKAILIFLFAIQEAFLISTIVESVLTKYSNSKEIKNIIEQNGYEEYKIFALHSPYASSILPYFPEKTMLSVEDFQEHTYVVWDKNINDNNRITYEEINYLMHLAEKEYNRKVIFLADDNMLCLDGKGEIPMEKIYPINSDDEATNETICMYKMKDY